jgi:DNA primase
MRYPQHLLDEIRARLPVSQVVARRVQLKRAGREYKGLSPFKSEKTASFFVNDQKGFYHCFASGEHGDIFTFLIKTEGLTFPEAVERLAAEAGVELPKPTEHAKEVEDERQRLYAATEAAAVYFEANLLKPEGREALRYIEGRALTRETIQRFRIGYAPRGRSNLKNHLARQGFSQAEMIKAGLLVSGDDIPVSYDRFRDRVMFPILDLKERVIAFGGRTLEKDGQPKYLNSPETPLFRKGSLLFNAAKARRAAHDKGRLIVVEGYMDVIALAQAGFAETVAPLGTALTENQLELLWRSASEPILCFDGDSAGRRAAHRSLDVALARLLPGRSLRYAFLPEGLDPDDLVRQEGPAAFEAILARNRPLFDVLIEREEGLALHLNTPEQRAALEVRLKTLIGSIADQTVRGHYQQELREVLWARSRRIVKEIGSSTPSRRGRRDNSRPDWRVRERALLAAPADKRRSPLTPTAPNFRAPSNELQQSLKAAPLSRREAMIMRTLLVHPWLIEEHAEEIATIIFDSRALQTLRDSVLALLASHNALDRTELRDQLERLGLGGVLALLDRSCAQGCEKFATSDASPEDVSIGWKHLLTLHRLQSELRLELAAAERSWFEDSSEEAYVRLRELNRRLHEAEVGESPEPTASSRA